MNENKENSPSATPTKGESNWMFRKFGPTMFLAMTILSSLFGSGIGSVIEDEFYVPTRTRTVVTRSLEQEQETRNAEDSFRSVLRRAKDGHISISSAVLEIVRIFIQYNIPPSPELIEKITEIVREIVKAGTELAVEEGIKKLLELLMRQLISKPSPTPTAIPSPTPSGSVR
jgi:hypothetical protein